MTPKEVSIQYIDKSNTFLKRSSSSIFMGGIMAGMLIAMAGYVSYGATYDSSVFVGEGITKILRGIIFSFGLLGIVLSGGDLFTGTLLYVPGTSNKQKIELTKRIALVLFSNFVGSIALLVLLQLAGSLHPKLIDIVNPIAKTKLYLDPIKAVSAGFLCNFLVCLALRAMEASKDAAGKAIACILIITVFFIGSFEHSVANLFIIPAGLGLQILGLWVFYKTLFFVVLGNILGGVFLGYATGYIYKDI
ncbi:MAG: formate/nitrite transporter family protein [Tissierellia bacterium]|nr:formate/nitrite transporter family protein [Tissierellia bacterium]